MENNIQEGVSFLVFWILTGLFSFICFSLIRKYNQWNGKSEFSITKITLDQYRVALMVLPFLAFSCGFIYFTIRIFLLILGF